MPVRREGASVTQGQRSPRRSLRDLSHFGRRRRRPAPPRTRLGAG